MGLFLFPLYLIYFMNAISVGVIGASGYSGELLVQLLSRHPGVSDLQVASRSHAGKALAEVLPALAGSRFAASTFVPSEPSQLASSGTRVFFLALPHGVAAEFALPLVAAGKKVIDLSADFRLDDASVYKDFYDHQHPAPEWLSKTPYTLPEWSPPQSLDSLLYACPGCYPSSILLPLLPLIGKGLVDETRLVINSVSGVSGAGKKADEFYSFCERENSVLAYGRGKHRHLAEIEQELSKAACRTLQVQFTPHLVPMPRGIHTTIVVPCSGDLESVYQHWHKAYEGKPFIRILPTQQSPDTRHVVGSNRVDMSACLDARTGNLIITSALDNLLKGASGQSVQIFNLIQGYPETEALL
jgi:N-acetyl-gamma-glutamyl-phosphate reductase